MNDATLPVNGGTPATQSPPVAGNFDLYTSNCPTVVQVNYNGLLRLGMAGSSPNTATLLMAANSLLDLWSGGQADVNQGSVLRIAAGATLVVRSGTTLNVNGQLIVDDGAYICVENAASIHVGASGLVTVGNNAYRYANPALNLTGLACTPYAPCSSFTTVTGTYSTASGSSGPLQTVQFIPAGQVRVYINSPFSFTFTSNSAAVPVSSVGTNAATFYLGASSGVQITATATNASCPTVGNFTFSTSGGRLAFSPNPANEALTVTAIDPAAAAATDPVPTVLFEVDLYDGYGRKVKTQRSDHGKAVLNVRDLPSGLYNLRSGSGKDAISEHIQVTH